MTVINQPTEGVFKAMEGKDYRLVGREITVEFRLGQPAAVLVFITWAQAQNINDVDKSYLQLGKGLVKQVDCGQAFHGRFGTGSRKDHVRVTLVI